LPINNDRVASDSALLPALSSLRVRRDISLPPCSIEGCNEPATERLPENMGVGKFIWCKPHADLIANEIAMRNYRDFVDGMRQHGIKGEPIAQHPGPAEDRRCAIPRCKRGIITGTDLFSPYKLPGMVGTCALHSEILQQVVRNQNGHRVVQELLTQRKRKQDPQGKSLEKAIRSAYMTCRDRRPYTKCICRSLQKERTHKMPARWLDRWRNKLQLRVEPYDWLIAYEDERIRGTIQRHISKICKNRIKLSVK